MYGNSPNPNGATQTYYQLLGLQRSASTADIRRAYRHKSKQYHPDTTTLPPEVAKARFQQLNEAYATLISAEQRQRYDRQLGAGATSPLVSTMPRWSKTGQRPSRPSTTRLSSAYLDNKDRPLSPGELFALFILGITFVGCLVLALVVGVMRGEMLMQDPQFFPRQSSQLTATMGEDDSSADTTAARRSAPSISAPAAFQAFQRQCQVPHLDQCFSPPSSTQ